MILPVGKGCASVVMDEIEYSNILVDLICNCKIKKGPDPKDGKEGVSDP